MEKSGKQRPGMEEIVQKKIQLRKIFGIGTRNVRNRSNYTYAGYRTEYHVVSLCIFRFSIQLPRNLSEKGLRGTLVVDISLGSLTQRMSA